MTDEKNDEFNDVVEPDIEQPDVEPDIEHAGATDGLLGSAATPEHKLPTVDGLLGSAPTPEHKLPLLGAAANVPKLPVLTDSYCDVYLMPWPDSDTKFSVRSMMLQASVNYLTAYVTDLPYDTLAESVYHVHIDFPLVGNTNRNGTSGSDVIISGIFDLDRVATDIMVYKDGAPSNQSINVGPSLWLPRAPGCTQGALVVTGYVRPREACNGGYSDIDAIFGPPPSMPAVTVADLEARWHTLTDTEKTVASSLIGDAINYIKQLCPNYDDIPTDTVKRIVCAMVKRAMLSRDSSGISQQSETVGSFSASYTWSNPTGDLYLTREERRQLGLGAQHAGGWEL